MDWLEFWEQYSQRGASKDYLVQVGRTANGGQPTPERELAVVIQDARNLLGASPEHRLLDLCCGNGFLTVRLARHVASVVGVDFSPSMLSAARAAHQPEHVSYIQGSVLELADLLGGIEGFDRVVMLESLHYFMPPQLPKLLAGIHECTRAGAVAVFTGVTDVERKRAFYNTPERWAQHLQRTETGKDPMGHWWSRDEIERAAVAAGFSVSFSEQSSALNTAHYRFDVRLERN